MAVTYSTAAKTARMTAVVGQIDAGAGAGKLKIYTSGGSTLLATFTLADPCGTVSGAVLTFDFDPDLSATAGNTGTAAVATITDDADTVVISGLTVGTSGTDIVLDSVSITSGQTVTLATGTLTHA
jgi:hypothetical protein